VVPFLRARGRARRGRAPCAAPSPWRRGLARPREGPASRAAHAAARLPGAAPKTRGRGRAMGTRGGGCVRAMTRAAAATAAAPMDLLARRPHRAWAGGRQRLHKSCTHSQPVTARPAARAGSPRVGAPEPGSRRRRPGATVAGPARRLPAASAPPGPAVPVAVRPRPCPGPSLGLWPRRRAALKGSGSGVHTRVSYANYLNGHHFLKKLTQP